MRALRATIIIILTFVVVVVLFNPNNSRANTLTFYSEDFSLGVIGNEWSFNQTEVAPNGERFLGMMGTPGPTGAPFDVTLTLAALPQHVDATVSFSLYVVSTWDGNSNYCCGPDIWQFSVDDGPILMETTFSNTGPYNRQAYPGTYGTGDYQAGTGSASTDVLGYLAGGPGSNGSYWYGDSEYNLSFTFPHNAEDLTFRIHLYGAGLQPWDYWLDEGFGIDNVKVTLNSTAVPEPSTILLFSAGLLGLGLMRWKFCNREKRR